VAPGLKYCELRAHYIEARVLVPRELAPEGSPAVWLDRPTLRLLGSEDPRAPGSDTRPGRGPETGWRPRWDSAGSSRGFRP
jgi:hypothetical protein